LISVRQSATYYLPITIHIISPYYMAATDSTIDRVEFCDIIAPYVSTPFSNHMDGNHMGGARPHVILE